MRFAELTFEQIRCHASHHPGLQKLSPVVFVRNPSLVCLHGLVHYCRGRQTLGRGPVPVREEIVTGPSGTKAKFAQSDRKDWHKEQQLVPLTTTSLLVGPSYCGKASTDLSLNQCHDDLRLVINLHVPNIYYFTALRTGSQNNARLKPVRCAKKVAEPCTTGYIS